MSKKTTRQVHALEKLRLPELQAKYAEVTGEKTRSPNRVFLLRRITAALQAGGAGAKGIEERACAANDETARQVDPTPAVEKLTKLDVPALQARYIEVVGRPTGSDNKAYLIWKIREAQKGRITVGPRRNARREGVTFKVLPLRMESALVDKLDEVWRKRGVRNRTEFLRQALQAFASTAGEPELAELLEKGFAGDQP